ncbi:MAG: hypothetical protein AAB215_05525 [Planctomycetota bacterium]
MGDDATDAGRPEPDLPDDEPPPSRTVIGDAKIVFGILLVAAVAAVIAAIAIPSLLRSNHSCESSPIASLKTIVTAEEQYKSTSGSFCYAALTQLSATTPQYVDSVLGGGKKSGYTFVLVVGKPPDSNWYCTGAPVTPAKTGNRYFFVDSSGVIRFSLSGPPTSASAAIE